MGGPLGLGGSDGKTIEELTSLGAEPIAGTRAREALRSLKAQSCFSDIDLLTCAGSMGGDSLVEQDIKHRIVYEPPATVTCQNDTVMACDRLIEEGIEFLLFVGGDGTARDIFGRLGKRIPLVGVPSGVKMHSSVFLNKPESAGAVVQQFHDLGGMTDGEIMDVDEELFRAGKISARLIGIASIPEGRNQIQTSKSPSDASSVADELKEIAEYFVQSMEPGVIYLLGTGSTIAAVSRRLGIEKNELSVNAVIDGREIGRNLAERDIQTLIKEHPNYRIVVTPIGGQGFVFGRGNPQISSKILSETENEKVIIIATPSKLAKTRTLWVDSGDRDIDSRLRGYWKVLTGYAKYRVVEIQ